MTDTPQSIGESHNRVLELREGAQVEAADGTNLGKIDQFVVEPSTTDVTHLVVRKGIFFTDDKVIPIKAIDHVDVENQKAVTRPEVDPDQLPEFEIEHYVTMDDETRRHLDNYLWDVSMWRFPAFHTAGLPLYPVYPSPRPDELRELATPPAQGKALVGEQTPVVSAGGDMVGEVAAVYVDEEGSITHLVAHIDLLSGERLIPAHWIDSIDTQRVSLAVSKGMVESLEPVVA